MRSRESGVTELHCPVVSRFGQLKALLGSDSLENGGEFGERCDANPEPSIVLMRTKARVETMGRPLSEEDEDIVHPHGKRTVGYGATKFLPS